MSPKTAVRACNVLVALVVLIGIVGAALAVAGVMTLPATLVLTTVSGICWTAALLIWLLWT